MQNATCCQKHQVVDSHFQEGEKLHAAQNKFSKSRKVTKTSKSRLASNEEEMALLQRAEFKEAFQEFDKVTNNHCFYT